MLKPSGWRVVRISLACAAVVSLASCSTPTPTAPAPPTSPESPAFTGLLGAGNYADTTTAGPTTGP